MRHWIQMNNHNLDYCISFLAVIQIMWTVSKLLCSIISANCCVRRLLTCDACQNPLSYYQCWLSYISLSYSHSTMCCSSVCKWVCVKYVNCCLITISSLSPNDDDSDMRHKLFLYYQSWLLHDAIGSVVYSFLVLSWLLHAMVPMMCVLFGWYSEHDAVGDFILRGWACEYNLLAHRYTYAYILHGRRWLSACKQGL